MSRGSGKSRPFQDNVFIRHLEEQTESGIIIIRHEWMVCPACDGRKCRACNRRGKVKRDRVPVRAVVVASGPGYTTDKGAWIPNQTRAGDVVLVDPLAGDPFGDVIIVRDSTQVMAILEEKKSDESEKSSAA